MRGVAVHTREHDGFFQVYLKGNSVHTLRNDQVNRNINRKKCKLLATIPCMWFFTSHSSFYGFSDTTIKHIISKYYRKLLSLVFDEFKNGIIGATHYNHLEVISPQHWELALLEILVEADVTKVLAAGGASRY